VAAGNLTHCQEIQMMSMKRMKPMAVLAGVLLLFSVAAQAAEAGPATMRTMEMMNTMDKDGDRFVTKEEFMAYHEKMFAMMDKKKAGMLDKADWLSEQLMISDGSSTGGGYAQGGKGMRTMEMMEAMDSNKDHKLTKDEFMGYHEKMFAMMDKNKDAKLSADEWLEKQRKSTDG
jgi:hypothetical protein